MTAKGALVQFWRVFVPAFILLSGLAHHHDSVEDADHCEYCVTVVDGRKRLPTKTPCPQLTSGGRPGLEPFYFVSAASPQPVTPAQFFASVAVLPAQVSFVSGQLEIPAITAGDFQQANLRRGPPRDGSPRAPPTPA